MKWLFKIIGFIAALLGKKPKIPVKPEKVASSVEVIRDTNGNPIKKVVKYADGSTEEVAIHAEDPTNVGGFVDSLPK